MTNDLRYQIEEIERISQTEVGRNIGELTEVVKGNLYNAAQDLIATPEPSVVILTGTYVPWATPPAAETDGPPGAVILAAGLCSLGITVSLVTDPLCLATLTAAVKASGLDILIETCSDAEQLDQLSSEYVRRGVRTSYLLKGLGRR